MWCGNGAAPPMNYGPAASPSSPEDCDDCVETRVHHRMVTVPCRKNVYRTEAYRVPRVVPRKVEREVKYQETMHGTRQESYQVMVPRQKFRTEMEAYRVPVQKQETVMVPVTKKVPVMTLVDKTFQEPRTFNKTVYEDRTRQKVVPYTVQEAEMRSRAVPYSYQVPRSRKEYQTVHETVYDTRTRQVCTPVTKYVRKMIPYTTVHAKNDMPCPPGGCPPDVLYGTGNGAQAIINAHGVADANKDGKLTPEEAVAAAKAFAPGGGISEGVVRARMAAMDTNADGVVDVNEALAAQGWRQSAGGNPGYGGGGYYPGNGGGGYGGYPVGGGGGYYPAAAGGMPVATSSGGMGGARGSSAGAKGAAAARK